MNQYGKYRVVVQLSVVDAVRGILLLLHVLQKLKIIVISSNAGDATDDDAN